MNIIGLWYIIFMSLPTFDICKQVVFSSVSDANCVNIHFSGTDGVRMTDYFLDYQGCFSGTDASVMTLNTNRTMRLIDLFESERMIVKIEDQILVLTRNLSDTLYPVDCHR